MKHQAEQELQISEFIKDPASLKLLILAGTKIRANEIATVNKCVSLIKLDLSSNQLMQLPLKVAHFAHLRILYLHDNSLSACTITHTNLQYLSLFDNPIKNYRAGLVQANQKLLAIDHNVITKWQRVHLEAPKPYSELKWPIVQISQALQHQQDYLNLLKAELFVISQVYKRAVSTELIKNYIEAFIETKRYSNSRNSVTSQEFFKVQAVRKAATHWINFTQKKKKLRQILQGTSSQYLLMNQLQRIKMKQSPGARKVLNRFVQSLRQIRIARKVLQRGFHNYRLNIPAFNYLTESLKKQQLKLYFLDSQYFYLEKIFLYVKKLYFNKKQYDICDNFDSIVSKSKRSFFVLRKKQYQSQALVQNMVKFCIGLVLCQKNIDKRNRIYNRRGHKKIQIKKVHKIIQTFDKSKSLIADQRIERLYQGYDSLIEYKFTNEHVFQTVLRLIKYFNSGNAHLVLQTKAAYFQTEVQFEQKETVRKKEQISFTCHFLFKRALAANTIQKAWRRYQSSKKLNRNIFSQIRTSRAKALIGKWLRDLTFRHRIQLNKYHSFINFSHKDAQLFMQIDIYMSLPAQQNLLRYKLKEEALRKFGDLYHLLHTKTEVEIVEVESRGWLKVKFLSIQQALEAQKLLSIWSYRYFYNGTFIKFFTLHQLHATKELLLYESKINKLFSIKVNHLISNNPTKVAKKIEIDNPQPFFIWPYVEEGFASMFKAEQVQSLPISIFIYNKNRRPLKINCDLLWISPLTIYYFKKKVKAQLRVRTPKKQLLSVQQTIDISKMAHIRHKIHRERQFSMKQHTSLLQANKQRGKSQLVHISLLSQTLNIKKKEQ